MKSIQKKGIIVFLVLAFAITANAGGQLRYNYVPDTISPEAQKELTAIYDARAYTRIFPEADDLEGWKKTHAGGEANKMAASKKAIADNNVTVTEAKMGGVPVLDIRPQGWKDNGKVLVYTHGGAYTMFSARSTLNGSTPMARVTGLRVISVDYTTAPFAKWKKIQDQVISVFKDLNKQGYAMKDIALFGDSAGGGLAASTVLNLRDRGMGMPAAVVLLSPWADISDAGDTMQTISYTDPLLHYEPLLRTSAEAYANGIKLTDPRVSPIYGDFSKGFSPSLITDGTKCIFLSTSVRLYQALEAAGNYSKLDIYEGMWHVFQVSPSPETEVSLKKISDFFHKYLGK